MWSILIYMKLLQIKVFDLINTEDWLSVVQSMLLIFKVIKMLFDYLQICQNALDETEVLQISNSIKILLSK